MAEPKRLVSRRPLAVAAIITFIFESALGLALSGRSLTDSQISTVSQMIVQLDSFLTAGAAVGISIFWSGFVGSIRQTEQDLSDELASIGYDASPDHQSVIAEFSSMEKEALPIATVGVACFVLSAMLSVFAEMFASTLAINWSLVSLVIGVGVMFFSWYSFNVLGSELNLIRLKELGLFRKARKVRSEESGHSPSRPSNPPS